MPLHLMLTLTNLLTTPLNKYISYETANKLELATGVPARMWNNLEAQYREQM
jgi:plasmid maintenance system antidote protein VapI